MADEMQGDGPFQVQKLNYVNYVTVVFPEDLPQQGCINFLCYLPHLKLIFPAFRN